MEIICKECGYKNFIYHIDTVEKTAVLVCDECAERYELKDYARKANIPN